MMSSKDSLSTVQFRDYVFRGLGSTNQNGVAIYHLFDNYLHKVFRGQYNAENRCEQSRNARTLFYRISLKTTENPSLPTHIWRLAFK